MAGRSSSRKVAKLSQKSGSMAQTDLRRVERCKAQLDHAREMWRLSILDAVASGETYKDVARHAGISHQRVGQIVNEARDST